MHGRPRKSSSTPKSAQEENASALKANKIKSLQSQFLHNHRNKIYTQEALDVNEKLIEANPEFMTAWNYRKLAFENKLQTLINEELRVVENALKKNFKSYGAWHHRKWVVSKGDTSTEREIGLLNKFQVLDNRNFHAWNYRRFIAGVKNIPNEKELKYTTDMIDSNFSNYSAWHNRSVLLSNLLEKKAEGYFPNDTILKDEYDYVRSAIFTDEDDQSGWFYHLWLLDQTVKVDRPTLISSWPPHGSDISQVTTFPVVLYFDEPVEGVTSRTVTVQTENDIFKDVTWTPLSINKSKCAQAWMTHLSINSSKNVKVKVSSEMSDGIISLSGVTSGRPWSFGFTISVRQNPKPAEGENISRLSYAEESFSTADSNLESKKTDREPSSSSKWKSETIATEIDHYRDLLTWAKSKKIGKLTLARLLMAYDDMANMDEVLQLYTELMELDPAHKQYYKDEYSLAFLKQVTSSKESLLKYSSDSLCLRLNNLSLSRIGSFERLLWVHSLDLSHNQLHNIEGLEALQLLSCLNLSHNKLTSFTALDPLRLLKSSLKVLDISYNEIGAHTVDTRRYLCSSPMSHTLDYDAKFEEFANGDSKLVNFWDAYSIFGGLDLTQLDIVGNVAADERFLVFLAKLMPGLKWLDGKELN